MPPLHVIALLSGGKDSVLAALKCREAGHHLVALANLHPESDQIDELDSQTFQTVGHHAVPLFCSLFGVPVVRRETKGEAKSSTIKYKSTQGDEVEDLFSLLKAAKKRFPEANAVCSGAVESNYQRLRVEHVCGRLNLQSLAPLWMYDGESVIRDVLDHELQAVIVKTASMGLSPKKFLGREIDEEILSEFHKLNAMFGFHVGGEGGEYESLALTWKGISSKIVIRSYDTVVSDTAISATGHISGAILEIIDKISGNVIDQEFFVEEYMGCTITSSTKLHPLHPDDDGEEKEEDSKKLAISYPWRSILHEIDPIKLHLQCACDESWAIVSCMMETHAMEGIEVQTDFDATMQAMSNELNRIGYKWEETVHMHLEIPHMAHFGLINQVFSTYFEGHGNFPARECVEYMGSYTSKPVFHIRGIFSKKERKMLRVESQSQWAPRMIGPYSQACSSGDVVFVAGQIGLDPWSMQFVEGGWEQQFAECVRHVESILKVMRSDLKSSLIVSVWMEASVWSDETIEKVRCDLGPRIDGRALFSINPTIMLPRAALVEVCVVARIPSEEDCEWKTWKGDCRAMRIPSGQIGLVMGTKECVEHVKSSDFVMEYLPLEVCFAEKEDSAPSSKVLSFLRNK
eukprot:TRINITY_DN11910_c0_g1_i1.p1 TRINITY_DN11910_c0_g1~~TRINITY_DN11910_c0_g1_i1.p1  ORF type:complete len:653 (-),score=176.77 TRINITY_DN11910_c0_g1_i1:1562-3451(-)